MTSFFGLYIFDMGWYEELWVENGELKCNEFCVYV